ncbi:putative cytosol aminopeptidase [Tetrabaena socialis]|uniref:Putative cytosol aminopeptidase n=1 Tax=Tetrabaena socialis TaxID=47790 RepID=A0A2J7ZMA4_9CHLO|nr:putative cytosol aminopeptidase [Tetrabaena socialis]|eukprot:PNH01397.1 putative cytosol aminopeptidase [Tetrabaena socialis]
MKAAAHILIVTSDEQVNSSGKRRVWMLDQSGEQDEAYIQDVERALASADIARDMENEPANQMTPDIFCKTAIALLKPFNFKVTVLDEAAMAKEGMGLVLAVGQSSSFPPRFMVVEHFKNAAFPTVCLVGKGVTFDAGGLRIKSPQGMIDMKQDKSGASVVVSIMHHLALHHRDLPINLVGLMPMVENVINGKAMKPGDIVKAHNGTHVEIMDPDAEGRLILADAISYSARFKPDYVLDFATLTSYATQLCCDLSAAYYTVNDALSQLVFSIGEAIGERVWRHPPWPEYKLNTMSPVADSRNAHFDCTRSGSFMAAMFISNFVQGEVAERWVHFDIANNDVKGVHSANCSFMGMQLVKALAEVGTKRADYRVSRKSKTVKKQEYFRRCKSNVIRVILFKQSHMCTHLLNVLNLIENTYFVGMKRIVDSVLLPMYNAGLTLNGLSGT